MEKDPSLFLRNLLVAGAAVGALALSGCGFPDGGPEPTPPNGTVTQVEHDLGYDKGEPKEPVRQRFSFYTPGGTPVEVYNLTNQPVNRTQFEQTVDGFAGNAAATSSPTYTFPIYPKGGRQRPEQVTAFPMPRKPKEMDFVFVPNPDTTDFEWPPIFDGGGPVVPMTQFEFKDDNPNSQTIQTISVIPQPTATDGTPAPFETGPGMFVEACQATSDVLTVPADDSSLSPDPEAEAIARRLGQETFCNSEGDALQRADSGVKYPVYKAEAVGPGTTSWGDVVVNHKTYEVKTFLVPERGYGDPTKPSPATLAGGQ